MFPTPALDDLCEEYGVEPMPMPRDMPGVSAERVAIGEKQVELAEISVRGSHFTESGEWLRPRLPPVHPTVATQPQRCGQ